MMKARLIGIFATVVILVSLLVLSPAVPRVDAQTGTAATTGAAGGPAAKMSPLVLSTHDGVPSGINKANWNKTFGVALMTAGSAGTDSMDIEMAGLVPNGMYSAWWINTTPSVTRGLLGKAPADSFTADAHGNVSTTFEVPSDNNYQLLTIVYSADNKMHGTDNPGQMGSEVYTQLVGQFPSSGNLATPASGMMATQPAAMAALGVTKATSLVAVTFNGIPPKADKTMWTKQIGVAAMTMGTSGTDSVVLRLGRLIPNGLYTAWWTNTTPKRATGILGKAPGDPINADADGWASLSFEIPSDNNYQRLGVFYQADGKMPGTDTPGVMGSVAYIALIGAFPGPAGVTPATTRGTPSATTAATMAATTAK